MLELLQTTRHAKKTRFVLSSSAVIPKLAPKTGAANLGHQALWRDAEISAHEKLILRRRSQNRVLIHPGEELKLLKAISHLKMFVSEASSKSHL